jgi:hypothetical protein
MTPEQVIKELIAEMLLLSSDLGIEEREHVSEKMLEIIVDPKNAWIINALLAENDKT